MKPSVSNFAAVDGVQSLVSRVMRLGAEPRMKARHMTSSLRTSAARSARDHVMEGYYTDAA